MSQPTHPGARSSSDPRRHSDAERLRYWLVEERRRLLDTVRGLSDEQAAVPLEPGGWCVQQILAHRLFWEGREAEALAQYLLGRRVELLQFSLRRLDGANAAAVDTLRRRSSGELLRALRKSRQALRNLAQRIPDAALNDPQDEARAVLGIALEHDREHARQIGAWRAAGAAARLPGAPHPAHTGD